MEYNGLPEKQGLYDPQFEHDACGIGFIANIKGKTSHGIINQAIQILKNLAHRGGVGSEPDTGDGAGILIQMPHAFMKKVCKNEGIKLPKKGDYGVGMLFLSPDKDTREESLERLTKIIDGEEQKLLGIREVPVYDVCIGNSAREAMPHIVQVFIGKGDESLDADSFERKLYIIGKLAEKEIRKVSIIEFDEEWFRGKAVIVFDDVITRGISFGMYANQLESFGANVIEGIFLARTHYKV